MVRSNNQLQHEISKQNEIIVELIIETKESLGEPINENLIKSKNVSEIELCSYTELLFKYMIYLYSNSFLVLLFEKYCHAEAHGIIFSEYSNTFPIL